MTMNKIKILFVLPSLRGGGAERVVLNIVSNLNQDIFEVMLAVISSEGEYKELVPGNIKFFDLGRKRARYAIFRLLRLINMEKPAIVFGTIAQATILLFLLRKLLRNNFILVNRLSCFYSKTPEKKIIKWIFKKALQDSDYIISTSNAMTKDLIKATQYAFQKIRTIYNPVDIKNIQRLSMEKVKDEYLSARPIILACGRLSTEKGYQYLIKAMVGVVQKHHNAELLILGQGAKEQELKNLAKQLKIENKIKFLGFQKNPFKFMAKADLLISSSLFEGFPNVIVEAMTCGLPVISTDCQSGISEILGNGRFGELIPVNDSRVLAQRIINIIIDKELRERYSKFGMEKVKDFATDKIIKEYEDFFIKVFKIKNG